MQLGPGSLPGPNFFPRGERNLRLGGVYQIESGSEGGGCRLSPQRNFSSAPLGNPVAPSSVTFGDSFPPRGSLWVVQPYTKKAPQIRARTWAPYQPHYRSAAPRHAKTSEWERAGPKKGGRGPSPATLCVRAFSRESLDPPPGTGRETTLQVLTCDGPNGTTYRCQRTPGPISQGRNGPPCRAGGAPAPRRAAALPGSGRCPPRCAR